MKLRTQAIARGGLRRTVLGSCVLRLLKERRKCPSETPKLRGGQRLFRSFDLTELMEVKYQEQIETWKSQRQGNVLQLCLLNCGLGCVA